MTYRLSLEEVLQMLKNEVKAAGSMRKLAAKSNMSAMYISKTLRGKAPPGPRICQIVGVRQIKDFYYLKDD